MNKTQFAAYAADGYNRLPLHIEVLADLDTPLSTYLKLADGPYSYLFESVFGGEKWGRYSIIGLPCKTVLTVTGRTVSVTQAGALVETHQETDPLAFIETFRRRYRVPEIDGLPGFSGGLVGFFGYDTIRYIEPRLAHNPNPDDLGTPDIQLLVSEEVVVFDNLRGRLQIVVYVDPASEQAYESGQRRLQNLVDALGKPVPRLSPNLAAVRDSSPVQFESQFTEAGFKQAVQRAREYIIDGDAMQVVLSQRLSAPFHQRPLDLYRALRCLNPSPYLYYLNLQGFHIVGSSPEILVRAEAGEVTVRPIAGTRPRGKTPELDLTLERELLADPKELAEHLMLIDLGRNDVGRVAQIGSVRVTEKMLVERYSHVMHIVSNVVGRLKEGLSSIDVLRATFPAGTLSGAPKIRAMEIIDELEPVKRGIYGGAVGYIGWKGNMDTAIAIRTAVIKGETIYTQTGAGIVYDSIPQQEWEETMNKAMAMFKAVEMVNRGLL